MPSVGTAYVNIRVSTKGFDASLNKYMASLSKKMEKAGADAGKSFDRGMKSTNFDSSFSKLTGASERASNSVIADFELVGMHAKDMGTDISEGAGVGGSALSGLADEADQTRNSMSDLDSSSRRTSGSLDNVGNSGGRAGGGLRSGGGGAGFFGNKLKELQSEAASGQAILRGLYQTAAFGGTAMAGAASAASAAGQAIFAIGANAAAAAPAVAVLANGMMSLAQVGGVMALAMKGAGSAITAGFKSADASAKAAVGAVDGIGDATAAAARAVRDAKDALQDAYRAAARAAEDAARRTAQAERDLAEAIGDTEAAQLALNAARREALEQLEDIAFAAEDAGLAEERAALALQDAHQELLSVSELAPDDRARVEAELAFREAELNMRMAKDARQDADREQRKAAKEGVRGTEAMRGAREDLADAEEREVKARQDLADAQREEAETAIDNADRIAEAQQNLADAQRALADAQKKGTTATKAATTAADAYQVALNKLGDEQKEFVKTIVAMRAGFQDFSNIVTEPLFKDLNDALAEVNQKGKDNKSIMDIVTEGLIGTSEALGETVLKASALAQNDLFQSSLASAMDSNNKAIENFGGAVINLVSAFVSLAEAAGPLFVQFSAWVEAVTGDWAEKASGDIEGLQATIETAGTRVTEFWGLFKELWRWLRIVGGAANDAANEFDQMGESKIAGFIPNLTDALRKFNNQLDRDDLTEGFVKSLNNIWKAGRAVGNILEPLIAMGQSEELGKAFDTLGGEEAGKALETLGRTANEAVPALAELAVHILTFFAAISETGSITVFLEILADVAGVIADVVSWLSDFDIQAGEGETSILKLLGAVTGTLAAVRLLWKAFKIGSSPLTSFFKSGAGLLENTKQKGLFGGIKASLFGGGAAGKGGVAGAVGDSAWEQQVVTLLQGILTTMQRCCSAMGGIGDNLGGRGSGGGTVVTGGGVGGAGAAGGIPPTAGRNAGRFAGVMGKFSKVLGPATKLLKPLSVGLRLVGTAFRFLLGPFGIVLMLLPILWPLLVKLEEKTGIFSKTLDVLTEGFMWLYDKALKPLFDFLVDVAIAIWEDLVLTFEETMAVVDAVVDAFQWLWDKVKELFNWVKNNWPKILIMLTGPIGIAVALIIKHWDRIKEIVAQAVDYVVGYLVGMWNGITDGWDAVQKFFKDLWPVHIKPFLKGLVTKVGNVLAKFWDVIVTDFKDTGQFLKNLWPDHIKPFIQNLIKKSSAALSKFWRPISNAWNEMRVWLSKLWPDKVKPWIDKLITSVTRVLTNFWDGIVEGWKDLRSWLNDLWPVHIKPWLEGLVTKASNKLMGFWDGLQTGFKETAEWIIDHFNSWLIDPINSALKKFGVSKQLPRITMPAGMADGGLVSGRGGPREDNQLRRLSVGEYVLPAHVTKAVGVRNLEILRKTGKVPNTGGLWDALGSGISAGKDIVKGGVNSIAGAAAKGLAYALNWVIDQLAEKVPDNLAGNFVLGMGKQVALALKDYATKADKQKAKEKAAEGGVYTGKPGGWTKPIIGSYYISQYPNQGHSPSWSVDLAAPLGRPIVAASAGRVRSAISLTSSYGRYVVISHNGGVETLYAHLTNYIVKAGQKVKTGQVIGYLGSTGNSTGPHLHYEYKPSSNTVSSMAARGVRLAKGGVVAPSPDGTLALIAEAGKHERVTPLDSEGFTPAERRMLEALETGVGGGKGETFNVYPSQKMNEQELADKVARRVTWQRRRGAGSR